MSPCEICRHPFWDYHVESRRLTAKGSEVKRRRCSDCTACLEPAPRRERRSTNAPAPANVPEPAGV